MFCLSDCLRRFYCTFRRQLHHSLECMSMILAPLKRSDLSEISRSCRNSRDGVYDVLRHETVKNLVSELRGLRINSKNNKTHNPRPMHSSTHVEQIPPSHDSHEKTTQKPPRPTQPFLSCKSRLQWRTSLEHSKPQPHHFHFRPPRNLPNPQTNNPSQTYCCTSNHTHLPLLAKLSLLFSLKGGLQPSGLSPRH